jgi:Flp pilus assembly pilin Flp
MADRTLENTTACGRKRRQKGVTTVEYAVMLVLVAIAVLAFGSGIAGSVTNVFSTMISGLGWRTLSGMTITTLDKITKETKSMESIQVMTDAKKKQEKGVTTVEYAVMLVLVAIAVLAFGSGIANSVTGVFSKLASSLG